MNNTDSSLYQEVKDLVLILLELEENKPSYTRALCDSEDCGNDYQSYLEWSYKYRDTKEGLKELISTEDSALDTWKACIPTSVEATIEDIACVYVYLGGLDNMDWFFKGIHYTVGSYTEVSISLKTIIKGLIKEARHNLQIKYQG